MGLGMLSILGLIPNDLLPVPNILFKLARHIEYVYVHVQYIHVVSRVVFQNVSPGSNSRDTPTPDEMGLV